LTLLGHEADLVLRGDRVLLDVTRQLQRLPGGPSCTQAATQPIAGLGRAPVGAEQREDLAGLDAQSWRLERGDRAVALGDPRLRALRHGAFCTDSESRRRGAMPHRGTRLPRPAEALARLAKAMSAFAGQRDLGLVTPWSEELGPHGASAPSPSFACIDSRTGRDSVRPWLRRPVRWCAGCGHIVAPFHRRSTSRGVRHSLAAVWW